MKRSWNMALAFKDDEGRLVHPPEGGDEEALMLATALANMASADFIRSIIDIKTTLDRMGGEVRIGCFRKKFDHAGFEIDPSDETTGNFLNLGYVFQYVHRANLTREATAAPVEPDADFHEHIDLFLPEINDDSDGNPVDEEPADQEAPPAEPVAA